MKVGVTGHQDLGSPSTTEWVKEQVESVLMRERVSEGFSCLAKGADQIFAQALVDHNIPFVAVIACERIEDSFSTQEDLVLFRSLREKARGCILLPFIEPSEEAYYAAGKRLVDGCDMVIAIWDGKPARGLGGTGDVVQYACTSGRTVLHINPNTKEETILIAGSQ